MPNVKSVDTYTENYHDSARVMLLSTAEATQLS